MLFYNILGSWAGQPAYGMVLPNGMMVSAGPPTYSQVCPPGMYPQYPQYIQAGSIAASHMSGGSGGSGSQKSQKLLDDQVTIRSSGSSERSHSSKGSKNRKPMLDDRSSLSSFHSDTISLRSEIIAPDNRSISSHHSIPPMMVMPGPAGMAYATVPPHPQHMQQQPMLTPEQQQQIHHQMQQQQQMHQQIQQQLQQLTLQPPLTPQPGMSPQPPADHPQQQQQQHDPQQQQPPPPRELGRLDTLPASMSASRQSFRMAMGNTSQDFFVDVM